jgi:radical SAM/Cys-rich protein
METFEQKAGGYTGSGLYCRGIETVQVNLGLRCNQACSHCHVSASPERTEEMSWPVMEMVLRAADEARPRLVDLTGGSPEMNPDFRRFVEALTGGGHSVQVRTNLTALLLPGLSDIPKFLAGHKVAIVASMPCYLEENVRAQRGGGVYEGSIEAIRVLNSLGYGIDPGLKLDLVYNPGGRFLPPAQKALEADYRRELAKRFGLSFTNLLTITNMPVGRFWQETTKAHKDHEYMELLRESFNPETLDSLMCRSQISVGWDGTLYDCDFNLALGLKIDSGIPRNIAGFDKERLSARRIVTGEHCFGCTAGCGSSCKGALV